MDLGEIRAAFWCNTDMPGWVAGYLNSKGTIRPDTDLQLIATIVMGTIWYAVEMFIDRGDTPGADAIWKKVEVLMAAARIIEENPELVDASLSLSFPWHGPQPDAERLHYVPELMADHLTRSAHIHSESARRFSKRNTFFYCLGFALTRPYITKAMQRGDVLLPLPTARSAATLYALVQAILDEHAPHLLDGMVREYPTEHDPQIGRLLKTGRSAAQKATTMPKRDE